MSDKTTELIIYIADQTKDVPQFGATHLNKTLYYVDLMTYMAKGKKLTDLDYVRQENGPTPETTRFLSLLQILKDTNAIEEVRIPYFNYKLKRLNARRHANIDVFEKDEIVLIDGVIKKMSVLTARELSDLTHNLLAWQLSHNMEPLPDHTFLLTSKEPEPHHIKWGMKVAMDFLNSKQ